MSSEALPSYRAGAAKAPLLHFYERFDPFMTPDFALLRSLTSSDRWLVPVPAMHHHHFTSLGAVSIEATREFLDAFLSGDATALAGLGRRTPWPPLGPSARTAQKIVSRTRASPATSIPTRTPGLRPITFVRSAAARYLGGMTPLADRPPQLRPFHESQR